MFVKEYFMLNLMAVITIFSDLGTQIVLCNIPLCFRFLIKSSKIRSRLSFEPHPPHLHINSNFIENINLLTLEVARENQTWAPI